jgi:hypothetical protein
VDIQIEKVFIEPKTDSGATLLNLGKVCGMTNWEKGKKQELTTESEGFLCPLKKVPYKRLEIA